MSTRCVVRVLIDSNPRLLYEDLPINNPRNFLTLGLGDYIDLYRHFDGYPSGAGMKLKKTAALFNTKTKNKTAKALLRMIADDGGYQPTLYLEKDIEYFYFVMLDESGNAVIECYNAGNQMEDTDYYYNSRQMTKAEEFYKEED